ncbi:MAG: rhomboid family intramembrane serine protease [Flavobacteriales bacterium]
MNKYPRLTYILLPITIATILCIALISLSRWLFTIQFNLVHFHESVWEFGLPFTVAIIALIILRKRFHIIKYSERFRGRLLLNFIAAGAIGIPAIFSQCYFTTATGKLKAVTTVEEIVANENVRYYTIDQFSIDTFYYSYNVDIRTSGKHNQTLSFTTYYCFAFSSEKFQYENAKCWYTIKFSKNVSNNLEDNEKETAYEQFKAECDSNIKYHNFHELAYFERVPDSDDKDFYIESIKDLTKKSGEDVILLRPVNEDFNERNGNKMEGIFISYALGILVLVLIISFGKYDKNEHAAQVNNGSFEEDDLDSMLKYLIPEGDHFITSIIIALNLLIFLIMCFSGIDLMSPNGIELFNWGGNQREAVMNGEWWRLLTSVFVHGGLMHIANNIAGLVLAAIFVEPALGRRNYIILYVLSGLCASVASIWWTDHISLGASGAIFGLYGCMAGLLITGLVKTTVKTYIIFLVAGYAGLNLVIGFFMPGVGNAAHIGGLISGALIGLILCWSDKKMRGRLSEID